MTMDSSIFGIPMADVYISRPVLRDISAAVSLKSGVIIRAERLVICTN